MNLLIISTVNYDLNGISNVINNIYTNPIFEGKNISFLFPSSSNISIESELIRRKFKIYHANRKNIYSYFKQIRLIAKVENIDIIHIHGNSHTVAIELFAGYLAGCKIRIVHAHSSFCNQLLAHKMLTPLFNVLCTHRIACGRKAGLFMFGKHKFKIVRNSIDTNKYLFNEEIRNLIRKKIGINNEIVIGHVGLLSEIKNQIFLINIIEQIIKINDNFRLVLIGNGPLEQYLKEVIAQKKLQDHVKMLGSITNVYDYIQAFDIFIMPSLFEGFPLTMLEAQANGLPCLISNTITKEVDITDLVSRLPLAENISCWVYKILNIDINNNRYSISKNAIERINKCGFSNDAASSLIYNWYKII